MKENNCYPLGVNIFFKKLHHYTSRSSDTKAYARATMWKHWLSSVNVIHFKVTFLFLVYVSYLSLFLLSVYARIRTHLLPPNRPHRHFIWFWGEQFTTSRTTLTPPVHRNQCRRNQTHLRWINLTRINYVRLYIFYMFTFVLVERRHWMISINEKSQFFDKEDTFSIRRSPKRWHIFKRTRQLGAYGDDIVLVARNKNILKEPLLK